MAKYSLQLTTGKTEAVVLKSHQRHAKINFRFGLDTIVSKKCIKYLEIHLDSCLIFAEHIRATMTKANQISNSLMSNIGDPTSKKRMLLVIAVQSVLLYGAPIWSLAMEV